MQGLSKKSDAAVGGAKVRRILGSGTDKWSAITTTRKNEKFQFHAFVGDLFLRQKNTLLSFFAGRRVIKEKRICTKFSTSWGRWRLTVFTAWKERKIVKRETCEISLLVKVLNAKDVLWVVWISKGWWHMLGQMTKNSELMMRKAVSENLLAFLPCTAIVPLCTTSIHVFSNSVLIATPMPESW